MSDIEIRNYVSDTKEQMVSDFCRNHRKQYRGTEHFRLVAPAPRDQKNCYDREVLEERSILDQLQHQSLFASTFITSSTCEQNSLRPNSYVSQT